MEPRVPVLVDDPCEDLAVPRGIDGRDIPLGRLQPLVGTRPEIEEGEPDELPPFVGEQEETVAVGSPWPGEEQDLTLVRREATCGIHTGRDEIDRGVTVRDLVDNRQGLSVRRPGDGEVRGLTRKRPLRAPGRQVADQHILIGWLPVIPSVCDTSAVGCPWSQLGQEVLDLGLVGQRRCLTTGRSNQVQLVELIALMVPGEEERGAVRRPGNLAHRVLIVVGQLDWLATIGRLAPEVELAGGVGDVRDVGTVR